MTPEDITEIITRRLDTIIEGLLKADFNSQEYITLKARFNDLYETLHEILALKENETKDNQVN